MEQLVFELVEPEPPAFRTFVAGRNGEAVASLERAAVGGLAETSIVLWGPPGAGKSHLLSATVSAATVAGRPSSYCASPASLGRESPAPGTLVAVDDVGAADAEGQARLFTLYNTLRERGGTLVVAAEAPPARLPLRDDVRTRLSWGLVYEIVPLADAENARVAVRNVRRDVLGDVKDMVKEKLIGQDDEKRAQDEIQKLTDKHVADIDAALAAKEKEIMQV